MKFLKNNIIIGLFLLINILINHALAQNISVSLLNNDKISSVFIHTNAAAFKIQMDSVYVNTVNTSSIEIESFGDSILVKSNEKRIRNCKKIIIYSDSLYGELNLKFENANLNSRNYEGKIEVYSFHGQLKIHNIIDIEAYIEGVVEMEAGKSNSLEYYKLQSILCRTYALSNFRKHENENCNLCDKVHCQAYNGRTSNKKIINAVKSTAGLVIVDDQMNLISAAFHSNCGGQTLNSEDVWSLTANYLRSVKDTFCIRMPNAKWRKSISFNDWILYCNDKLQENKLDSNFIKQVSFFNQDSIRVNQLNYRSNYLPLKSIRSDWQLKSTFFSFYKLNDSLVFIGKGYGHGVGLCQEGAMRQARLNYSYRDIIHFYYYGVHIVDLNTLFFFKED